MGNLFFGANYWILRCINDVFACSEDINYYIPSLKQIYNVKIDRPGPNRKFHFTIIHFQGLLLYQF